MKRLLLIPVALLLMSGVAHAEKYWEDLLKADLRAEKRGIVGDLMMLTPEEEAAFWPLYDKYQLELNKIGDVRLELIKEYVDNYNQMTNDKAQQLVKKVLELDIKRDYLRRDYFRKFEFAVGSITAARFLQIERQLEMLVQVQVAEALPLLAPGLRGKGTR